VNFTVLLAVLTYANIICFQITTIVEIVAVVRVMMISLADSAISHKTETKVSTTGTFEFRLERISSFSGVGTKTTSPEFETCGTKWKLALYPNGNDESSKDYLSVYLENHSPKTVFAIFKISVLSKFSIETNVTMSSASTFPSNTSRGMLFHPTL
jgi:hypothetical protein